MPKKMLNEKDLNLLEANIPRLASGAFLQAYAKALTISGKVLIARDGKLIETSSDGSEKTLRDLRQPTKMAVGTKRIRKVVR